MSGQPLRSTETGGAPSVPNSGCKKLVLAANAIILAALAWHVALEAVPGVADQLMLHRDLTALESGAVLVRLLPYLLLTGYLVWRPRAVFRWSTAALALLSVVLYVAVVFGTTLHLHRAFAPV